MGTKLSRKFLEELQAFEIHLPSSYPADIRACDGLAEAVKVELAIRQADANRTLDKVRAHLAASFALSRHQAKSTTQQLKLRNRGPSQRLRSAMLGAANAYRRARVAMVALGMDEGDPVFKPLKHCHLKAFVVREADRQYGDSKNIRQSWIWGDLSFIDNKYDEGAKKHIIESEFLHCFHGQRSHLISCRSACTLV